MDEPKARPQTQGAKSQAPEDAPTVVTRNTTKNLRNSGIQNEAHNGIVYAVEIGQLISDRYRVIELLGSGGMGAVYRVEQIFLHKQFALKTLNAHAIDLKSAWGRFQKEAQAAFLFEHPNLIKVHDFSMIDDEQPFFVMDYVDGETLTMLIQRGGPPPLDLVLSIFIQVCEGLAHAHSHGVIHRDIKPSNIMLSHDKDPFTLEVKIVDFGIAKLTGSESDSQLQLTRTGEIFGTPFYMSPEQCYGRVLDNRADIYSLGCVLFETLTGYPPFLGETALTIMMQHQAEKPLTLKEASLGKYFPKGIELVVARMLEKDPKNRYQDIIEVARDLNDLRRGARLAHLPQRKTVHSYKLGWLFWGCVGVLVAVGIFAIGRLTAPPSTVATTSTETASSNASKSESSVPQESFYSTWVPNNPGTRFFRFPAASIGTIKDLDPTTEIFSDDLLQNRVSLNIAAKNTLIMQHFHPFGLDVGYDIVDHPEELKMFRPDELKAIYVEKEPGFLLLDKQLEYLTSLKSLRDVNLSDCKLITDECIAYLNELPNLTRVNLAGTRFMSGQGVANLKRLRHLQELRVGRLKNPRDLIEAIVGSTALNTLEISNSGLSNKDCSSIATLTNLEELNLARNNISNDGLAELAPLHKLRTLNLHGCRINSKSTAALGQFHSLSELVIPISRWSPEHLDQLHKLLGPQCMIYDISDKIDIPGFTLPTQIKSR